jgi:lipopolysaccharide/colanic/teichoic acid biosynthesis glycosyltransferase
MSLYRHGGKRLLDLAAIVLAAPVWVPLLGVIALLVRSKIGSPVLFRQSRPGWQARVFEILKFRTMTNACDAMGNLLPDKERFTPFGRWLRRTSLDELPELINVWRGEMSLVGPRPLLVKYLPLYTAEQMRRHEVTPGITGWAQINGRNAITWEEKFQLDVWYVDHRSCWLDMKILFLTIAKVLSREGVLDPYVADNLEFTGSAAADSPAGKSPTVSGSSAHE